MNNKYKSIDQTIELLQEAITIQTKTIQRIAKLEKKGKYSSDMVKKEINAEIKEWEHTIDTLESLKSWLEDFERMKGIVVEHLERKKAEKLHPLEEGVQLDVTSDDLPDLDQLKKDK